MWRRRLAAAVLVALIGAAAWWMLGGDDASAPESAPRSSAPATAEEPVSATERKSPRVRAARPDAEADLPRDPTASKAENEAAAKKHAERAFVVQTTDGKPIAGATVRVGSAEDASLTDANGRVRVVVPAEISLFVRADGFASRVVNLSKRWVAPDVIEMRSPQPVAGIVVDAAGRPVAGATVQSFRDVLTPVKTPADGRFAFADVDPDDWIFDLIVACDGFVKWSGQVHPGDVDVRVRLSHPCSIEGTVVLPDGTAVPEANLEAGDVDGSAVDGRFVVEGLSAGEHVVRAWSVSDGPQSTGEIRVRVADGEALRDVRIELREPRRSFVVLRVVGPAGTAAQFEARQAVARDRAAGSATVPVPDEPPGAETTLSLDDVRAGDVAYGRVTLRATTRASGDGAPDLIELPRLRQLTVVALGADGRPPAADARLEVIVSATSWPSVVTAMTPAGPGRFDCRVADGGSYRLHVRAPEIAEIQRAVTPEELSAGLVEVRLGAGSTVRARIVAPPPGRIADPWLVLRPAAVPGRWMTPGGGVRADGRYAIEHVPPGKWEALAVCAGSVVQKVVAVDVPDEGVVDLGDVEVPGTVVLKGRVVTADGRPAGGAELEYYDPAGFAMPQDGNDALSRPDGTFSIDVPVGARGELRAAKPECGGVIVPLGDAVAFTEVRLGAECRLRVLVKPAPGSGEALFVSILRPGGLAQWSPDGPVTEHGDGSRTYDLRGIAPGKWIVRIGDDDVGDVHEVTLSPSEIAEATFVSPR